MCKSGPGMNSYGKEGKKVGLGRWKSQALIKPKTLQGALGLEWLFIVCTR